VSAETALAYQYINTTLRADTSFMAAATGGVWESMADVGAVGPYGLYGRQAGSDVITLNAVRLWTDILVQIKMVGPVTSYAAMVTGAQRIDALFGSLRNIVLQDGSFLLSCYRTQEVAYPEPAPINGRAWSNLGGLYRFSLQGI
jgi:hypothetical protein